MTTPQSDPRIRRTGIGGTDVAPILGVSRFKGPFDVWAEKRGLSAPLVETEPMAWGLRLEDAVAQHWSRVTGHPVYRRPQTVRDPEHRFLMAHLDRLVGSRRTAEAAAILEVKTASVFAASDFGEPDTDEVPADYFLQGLHQAMVTNKPVVHYAVLIGGQAFRKYVYERDVTLERPIRERLIEWWQDHVVKGDPPDVDGSESAYEYLRGRYPRETLAETEMTDEIEQWALQYEAAKHAMSAEEARKSDAGNHLRDLLGEAGLASRNGITVRYSTVKSAERLRLDQLLKARPDLGPLITEFTLRDPDYRRLTVDVKES